MSEKTTEMDGVTVLMCLALVGFTLILGWHLYAIDSRLDGLRTAILEAVKTAKQECR